MQETYCGRIFNRDELSEIKKIVTSCKGLTLTELANTICELYSWKRLTQRLKTIECRQFLDYLGSKGIIHLPEAKKGRPNGSKTRTLRTGKAQNQGLITGKASQFFPLLLSQNIREIFGMNLLIVIIILVISYPLGHRYDILLRQKRVSFWNVCNSAVLPGRCRPGISGLSRVMSIESATCRDRQ